MNTQKPDLDNAKHITQMVHRFYDKLLADELMAPLFLEVAHIDLKAHLPTISLYWQKMLLGDKQYTNNTMAKHRDLNHKQQFQLEHYDTWLNYFLLTLETHFAGPFTDKAIKIAKNVIKNMKKQFLAA